MARRGAWLLAIALATAPVIGPAPARAQGVDPAAVPGTRPYCDARWAQMRKAAASPAQTYPDFLNACLARCPANHKGDPAGLYEERSRQACDARWKEMLIANTQGAETYDHYMRHCAVRCAPPYAAIGALAALGLVAGVAAGTHGGDHPASP